MSYRRRAIVAIALAAPLGGCVSGSEMASQIVPTAVYKPDPGFWTGDAFRFGYSEERVDERTWKVHATGTTVTPPNRVALVAEVRAAELGKLNGFSHFKVTNRTGNLHCAGLQGGSTAGAAAEAELVVSYAKTAESGFEETAPFYAKHIDVVRAETTPEEKRLTHLQMRAACDVLKARRRG